MNPTENQPSDNFESLRARLHRAIPGGAHTYSRGDDQFPAIAPPLFVRGKGAYAWDSAGNRFLDYGMALRAVTLGYADARVNSAAAAEMEKGVNLTRATLTELEAAETLIDLIPSVEMVKFSKNGSNVTTAAIKIARAFTGRRYVCVPRQQPFFSFDDWFIGTTALKRGIPADQTAATLVFDYNDIGSLQALFDAHPGEIAAVMLEPATTLTPCPPDCSRKNGWPETGTCTSCDCSAQNFLQQVQSLCRADGALFVLDEMITGFRWHLQGAQTFFGVMPDLCTFGKGMANGFSVSALCGKREYMRLAGIEHTDRERCFVLSLTHGAESTGLAACIASIEAYQKRDIIGIMHRLGTRLREGIRQVTARLGLSDHFQVLGRPQLLLYATLNEKKQRSQPFRTLFLQELLKRGILAPNFVVGAAHSNEDIDQTIEAVGDALVIYRRALDEGVEKFLVGRPVQPVFRKFN